MHAVTRSFSESKYQNGRLKRFVLKSSNILYIVLLSILWTIEFWRVTFFLFKGIDIDHRFERKKHRKEPTSQDVYLRLLVKVSSHRKFLFLEICMSPDIVVLPTTFRRKTYVFDGLLYLRISYNRQEKTNIALYTCWPTYLPWLTLYLLVACILLQLFTTLSKLETA